MGFFDFFKTKRASNGKSNEYSSGRPSRSNPTSEQGWYRFKNKEHKRTGKLNEETHWFEHKVERNVPYEKLRKKEIQKIKKYKPLWNKNSGGGGRKPNDSNKTRKIDYNLKAPGKAGILGLLTITGFWLYKKIKQNGS